MRRLLYSGLIVLTISVFLLAESARGQSTSGFDILRQETSARQSAMAGTGSALYDDVFAVFFNPAGLAGVRSARVGLTFIDQILDITSGCAVFSLPVSDKSVVGTAVLFTSYGKLTRTDETGQTTGSFTPGDFIFSASFASSPFERFKYGFSAKMVYSQIDQYSASAVAIDAGCIYSIPSQKLNVGLSLQNVGTSIDQFIDVKENLPSGVRAGFAKTLAHLPLMLNFEILRPFHQTGDREIYWAIGGEFTVSNSFFLRWGYSSAGKEENPDNQSGRFSGVSFGFGVLFNKYRLDYGWRSKGPAGSLNALTLNIPIKK